MLNNSGHQVPAILHWLWIVRPANQFRRWRKKKGRSQSRKLPRQIESVVVSHTHIHTHTHNAILSCRPTHTRSEFSQEPRTILNVQNWPGLKVRAAGTVCAIDCTEIASFARVSFNSKNGEALSDALCWPFDTQEGKAIGWGTTVIIYYKVGEKGNSELQLVTTNY